MTQVNGIDVTVPPSGTGCVECLATDDSWWFNLRRCAQCGHVGCCNSSPSQHATAHFKETGHPVMQSFEPGDGWFYSYPDDRKDPSGPDLAPPTSHPADQPKPGPAGRVPDNWESLLHK